MAVMDSAWKRAKRALGLGFCAQVPHRSTLDDVDDSFAGVRLSDASLSAASSDSSYRALIPTTPTPTSSGLRISKSKAKSSKVISFLFLVINPLSFSLSARQPFFYKWR